jgi:hypothetical protein
MTQERSAAIDGFYSLLGELEHRCGGRRDLASASANAGWPSHGLYFFFEPGETRRDGAPRVVRVGTHALTTSSRTTLWRRLAQHRGHLAGSNPGGGNHRGSIFRLHVGAALLRRDGAPAALVDSWLAKDPDPDWRDAERAHERAVSSRIGSMSLLWLSVPSGPDGSSARRLLERNTIALLSTAAGGVDLASSSWLGRHAVNPAIARSSLRNVNHVDETYDPSFLGILSEHVDRHMR